MRSLKDAIYIENYDEIVDILTHEPSALFDLDDGIEMSYYIAKTGDVRLIKYIVEHTGLNLCDREKNHRSLLHYAAMSGSKDACKYLVERAGLSPVEGDLNLITPIDIAHENKYFDLQEYFEDVIGAPYSRLYRNPIRTGFYPDPSIVRVNDDYYMANSSFVYFPCIPISHSKDLVHWHVIGYAITNPEWAGLDDLNGGRGYWAPDISYYKGKFYIAVTYRLNNDDPKSMRRRQVVVSSERPEGPYSEPSYIDVEGIDPSIFNDSDGRRYMLLNRGARIFEISEDATEKIGDDKLLYYGDFKRAPEGPRIIQKDGYYYLFLAEGGTGSLHRVTVARSRELMGVYEPCPYNPIMTQKDTGAMIQRCGHGQIVQTQNGQWYMVYLCGRSIDGKFTVLGRETALDPVTWTPDGWPIVNNLDGPSVLQIKPNLPETIYENTYFDDFEDNYIKPCWIFARAPEEDGISLLDSILYIKGSRYDMNSIHAKNMLLRRQEDMKFEAIVKMKMPDIYPGQDVGMISYYDENTYLKFGVFAKEDPKPVLKLMIEEYIDGSRPRKPVLIDPSQEFIYLKMVVNKLKRQFFMSYDGLDYTYIDTVEDASYLSDEGLNKGKRFTGLCLGMYAHAADKGKYKDENGEEQTDVIYGEFDSFEYKAL